MAMAAGIATIEEFERLDLISKSESLGNELQMGLDLMHMNIKSSGRGMVGALHFFRNTAASHICEKCLEKGLLLVETGKHTVKIGPPLTITSAELYAGLDIIKEVL